MRRAMRSIGIVLLLTAASVVELGAGSQPASTESKIALASSVQEGVQEEAQEVPRGPRAAEERVSLEELVAEALENNREIRAAQKKYEASRQRPSIASTLPDPMLSLASSNIGNPIPATTLGEQDMSRLGFELMQEIPFPGKLRLQGRMAQQEADGDWHGYRKTELEVVSRVKQAYFRLHSIYRVMDVVLKDQDLLEKFAQIAEARYGVGRAVQQDVLRAQLEISTLRKELVELERQQGRLVAEVNRLLNRPPESPLGRPEDYPKAALPASLDELYQAVRTRSPMLGQEQAMVERNSSALELARKEYYPDFAAGAGWFSRGGLPDMWEVRFGMKIPLYFWRKQRAAVRESASSLEQSRREYEATAQELFFRLKDDYLMAKASEQLLELYSEGIVPQATLALESSMASYQVGAVDFLSLLTNFESLLRYEQEYSREFANFHEALARLEETTGRRVLP